MSVMQIPLDAYVGSLSGSCDMRHVGIVRCLINKTEDYSFPAIIESIRKKGIIDPIVLVPRHANPYSGARVLKDPFDGAIQGNGHHRLAAAIVLGLPTVPVVFADDFVFSTEHPSSDTWERPWLDYRPSVEEFEEWRSIIIETFKRCQAWKGRHAVSIPEE